MKVINNIFLNLFFVVVLGVLSFLNNRYFGNEFGANRLGLINLFTQMIQYLSLADLGIASAAAYSLYKPLSEKNNYKVSIIVTTIDRLYKKISFMVLCLGMVSGVFLPKLIHEYDKIYYFYWIIYVTNLSLSYYFAKYSILFNANQEYGYSRKIDGGFKVVFQLMKMISILIFKSLPLFLFLMIIENILIGFTFSKYFKKNYSWILKTNEIDRNVSSDMKKLFWHKVSGLVVSNTDFIVISKFLNLSLVGIYSSNLMVINMLKMFISITTPAISPSIGKFIAENKKENIYKKWRSFICIYLILGILGYLGGVLLLDSFMLLWMGKEYVLNQKIIVLIMINYFLMVLNSGVMIFKTNSGYYNDIYNPMIEASLNLTFSLILVIKYGLIGVVIGTTISSVVVILFLKPYLVYKNCFDKRFTDYLKDFSLLAIKIIFIIFISIYLYNLIFSEVLNLNWNQFIVRAIFIVVISGTMSIIIFLTDKYFKNEITNLFVSRVLKFKNR